MTNINAFAREEEGNTSHKKENRNDIYILTVISILPAGWPPISMSKKTTGLDIYSELKFFSSSRVRLLWESEGAVEDEKREIFSPFCGLSLLFYVN